MESELGGLETQKVTPQEELAYILEEVARQGEHRREPCVSSTLSQLQSTSSDNRKTGADFGRKTTGKALCRENFRNPQRMLSVYFC